MDSKIDFYANKLAFEVDESDLFEALKNGEKIVVIDARKAFAFEEEHIPTAINIHHLAMNEETTKKLCKSFLYVIYCDSIGCNASTKGALNMSKLGFNVYDYQSNNQERMRKYPTDLTDSQWSKTEKYFTKRKSKYSLREIINALPYMAKTGVQWRLLPHEYPNRKPVYYYFRKWIAEGVIEEIHESLRYYCRRLSGRDESPGLGHLDSRSVKTSCASREKGYDAGKKVSGRKRHIVTDTMGLIPAVVIHNADIQDRDGARLVLKELQYKFPLLKKIPADGGYRGKPVEWTMSAFGWTLEIVTKVAGVSSFSILPKRWVVERTFGWFNFNRRLAGDYEANSDCSIAFVQIVMIRIMLNRIKI